MGWAKNDGKGKFGDLFEYYNDTLAFEPLYIYDEKGNKTKNLAKVVFKASKKIPSDLYASMRLDGVEEALVMSVGNAYVKARETVFRIFNMMTSRDKTNGYDYYNKDLEAFCKGDLSKQKM